MICITCKIDKMQGEFGKRKRSKSGYSNQCKKCVNEYMAQYYEKNPNQATANRTKQNNRDQKRNRFTRHKLPQEKYNSMLSLYEGKCWSCKERPGIVIDHDHKCCDKTYSCGKCVRGILCSQCNTALGLLKENEAMIGNLLIYLQQQMPH